MAFVHGCSEECTKSQLDLFDVSPKKTDTEESLFIGVPPFSATAQSVPLDFFIAWNGEDYTDLNNTLLCLCCKAEKADESNLSAGEAIGFVNYPVASTK